MVELSRLSPKDLLKLHAGVAEELRTRGITRSSNNPTGDLAEFLFCRAFGWTQAGNSQPNIDATAQDGTRYQIKGRRFTKHNQSRQIGAIRDFGAKHFDFLAGVLFDMNYGVYRAALVPYDVVALRSKYIKHTNSHKFILHDGVWSVPGVHDVTDALRAVDF
jgi:hypothetical protein